MTNEVGRSNNTTFYGTLGQAIGKFGKHLIGCVGHVYIDTIGEIVCNFTERSLSGRHVTRSLRRIVSKKVRNIMKKRIFKARIVFFIQHDTVRHVAKFLLFAAGTALLIPGMFSIPGAIVAFTILGIAVTRFIFKAVHIIKQASNNYFVGNRINTIIKTIFRLLIAAAEIPAFFFGGPLASLITQPISGAILVLMKKYDDIKINERIKKGFNQLDSSEISNEEDVEDEEDSEIDEDEIELQTIDMKDEE